MSENIDWTAFAVEDIPNFSPAGETTDSKSADTDKSSPSKRGRKPKTVSAPKPVPTRQKGKYVAPLTELYGFVGMGLLVVDPVCGKAVLESAEGCAKSVDELAYKNAAVRRVVESLTQTSAIGAVVMAHMPILLAVASHHGGRMFSAMMPTTIEAETSADDDTVSAT